MPADIRTRPIHQDPPEFVDLNPKTEILETGIKVVDLLCPFVRGGKIGLFGGAGVGKTVIIQEMIARVARELRRLLRVLPVSVNAPARATTSGARCSEAKFTDAEGKTSVRARQASRWCSAR